jgi:hypothetical protein
VSTKPSFSDLLSTDEIKTIRSSLRDASELLSRYNDTLVISRCHDCLENFLHLYDSIDPSSVADRTAGAPDQRMVRPVPGSDMPHQGGDASGFETLATGRVHEAQYDFASFDIDGITGPVMPEFGNLGWGGSLG